MLSVQLHVAISYYINKLKRYGAWVSQYQSLTIQHQASMHHLFSQLTIHVQKGEENGKAGSIISFSIIIYILVGTTDLIVAYGMVCNFWCMF